MYQFTKDFSTIWEQKPIEAAPTAKSSSASASAAASAPPAGEPVCIEETAAPATAATATAIQPLEQPPPSANYELAGSGCACASCYYDAAAALYSLPNDVAALTVSGNRDASHHQYQYQYTQAPATTESPPAAPAEQGLIAAGQAGHSAAAVDPSQEVSHHRHSPGAASAARSRGSKKSSRHHSHSAHKSTHHRAHGSDKAARNPKEIGDVVSAEKEKKYDPKRIVDNWVWEWGYGA